MSKVKDLLQEDSFYKEEHRQIYLGVVSLFKKNQNIDYVVLIDELKKMGTLDKSGGEDYIRELTNVMTASNYEVYARKIEEKAISRRIISICGDVLSKAYQDEDDVIELIHDLNDNVFKAQSSISSFKNVTPSYVGDLLIQQMLDAREGKLTGIPFGVNEIIS